MNGNSSASPEEASATGRPASDRCATQCQQAGTERQANALLARNPAAHVSLDSSYDVGYLLRSLHRAGADEQAIALAARAATHIPLYEGAYAIGWLLDDMRAVDAAEQAKTLVDRLTREAPFDLAHALADQQMRYRFGREPSGEPARSWSWDDLN
jgi:hypothetical protein